MEIFHKILVYIGQFSFYVRLLESLLKNAAV